MQEITDEVSIKELLQKEGSIIFFYTPFCQTCKIAERMLHIVTEAKEMNAVVYMCNLNYFPWVAEVLGIQSVPALTVIGGYDENRTLFAFESVVTIDKFLNQSKFV
ncbi:thioredoxin family protein [Bacillus sp. N1-1]|jgi:thioredoxin-like negative regulator of GroEL|uniref:thioredoxin family protein n=1 Tax=Bacillus sp. N1-1 TaxID=2682541 RepID=UPI0013161D0E|nr:thioredoxin family protein [Bacillus sp. N1-1]QHA93229.1 thioredoxin [Bacillus sp. N1-1]